MNNIPVNLADLRQKMLEGLEANNFTLDNQIISSDTAHEAIEELMAGIIREYMKDGQLTACEKIIGQLFLCKLE